jgi:hypothetical protein
MNLDTQRSPSAYIYGLPLFFHANKQHIFPLLLLLLYVSVPVLVRTSTGRVGLRNATVLEFTCSGKGRQSHFWGVSAGGTTTRIVFFFLVVRWSSSSWSFQWSALLPFYTASSGTTTSIGTCPLVHPALPPGYVSHMCWIKFMIGSIICIFIMLRYDR